MRGALPGAALAAAFAGWTLLAMGPLAGVDVALTGSFAGRDGRLYPLFSFLAQMGERSILIPLVLALAARLAWTRRTWEPVVVVAAATVALNLVVGGCKILTARGGPLGGDPSFFEQGMLYPSGHTANVALYFGLAVFLARRYGDPRGRLARVLVWLAWFAVLLMAGIALYRQQHWFTDMVGGLLAGGAVLRSTVHDRGLVRRLCGLVQLLARRLLRPGARPAQQAEEPERGPEALVGSPSKG